MAEIDLTQEINNIGDQRGYIDEVVQKIKDVPVGEDLIVNITCVGGDVFQGDRLHRALLSHKGTTKAVVIGLAASMGGVLLSAFDDVELDSGCDVMLHKAHIPELAIEDYAPEQIQMCETFNRRAHSRLSDMGVSEKLLNEIFLSDETKDVWLTAEEAEAAGLGKVTKIERRDSQPFKVAAKLDTNFIKNKYKEMGIFSKKENAVAKLHALTDGRQVMFTSEVDEIKVGDKLTLIGSKDKLVGKIKLSDELEAEVDDKNEVINIEEVETPPENVRSEEDEKEIDDLKDKVKDLEAKLAKAQDEDEEDEEKKKEDEEELEDKAKANLEATKAANDLLAEAKKIASEVKSKLKLNKIDDKHEPKITAKLSEKEQHVRDLIDVRNQVQQGIKTDKK